MSTATHIAFFLRLFCFGAGLASGTSSSSSGFAPTLLGLRSLSSSAPMSPSSSSSSDDSLSADTNDAASSLTSESPASREAATVALLSRRALIDDMKGARVCSTVTHLSLSATPPQIFMRIYVIRVVFQAQTDFLAAFRRGRRVAPSALSGAAASSPSSDSAPSLMRLRRDGDVTLNESKCEEECGRSTPGPSCFCFCPLTGVGSGLGAASSLSSSSSSISGRSIRADFASAVFAMRFRFKT